MVDEIEITKLDEESRENLRTWTGIAWDIFNELIDDGSIGKGLDSEPTKPDAKD